MAGTMRRLLLLASASLALLFGRGAAWAAETRDGISDDRGLEGNRQSGDGATTSTAPPPLDAFTAPNGQLMAANSVQGPLTTLGPPSLGRGIIKSYDHSDFARYQPTTALDMVSQLPGFAIEEGEAVRGLAGGYGNVLINGRAPSSKSMQVKDRLARIPAAQVRAIEVTDAIVSALVGSRQGLVANVITESTGEASGATTLVATAADGAGGVNLELEAQDGDDRRTRRFSAGLYEEATQPPKGRQWRVSPLSEAEVFDHSENRGFSGEGTIAWEGSEGRRLEVAFNGGHDRGSTLSEIRPSSADLLERFRSRYVSKKGEATASLTKPIGARAIVEVTALHSEARTESLETAQLPTYQAQDFYAAASSESVLRATLTRRTPGSLVFSVGAEGTFNRLDGRSVFVESGQAVNLPAQDVVVSERRGEAFARLKGALNQAWSYDLGVTVEAAELRLKGGPDGQSKFHAVKPDASLVFTPDTASRLSLSLARRVGQLNFSDFVTSAALEDRTVALGAPRLEPVRRWDLEFSFRRTFWTSGAFDLYLTAERIDNPQELVPLLGQDAPGNLGAADAQKISTSLTLPVPAWTSLKGATLSGSIHHQRSTVRDPVTDKPRRLSSEVPTSGELRFRQDIPDHRLRWGFDLQASSSSRTYRVSQVKSYRPEPTWGADLEYRPDDGLSLRFRIQGGGSVVTERVVYARRADPSVVAMQERRQTRGALLAYLTVRKAI